MRAIIIDDEEHCISRLSRLIDEYCKDDVSVSGVATDIAAGIELVKSDRPDLVFLDVQIGRDNGFEFIRALPEENLKIVFTTAFEKYAVDAFKVNAVDYLLKPIDPDDLCRTVSKLRNANSDALRNFQQIVREFGRPQTPHRIAVSTATEMLFIDVDDIIRCKSDINYTTLFLRNQKTIVVSKTLKEFEQQLSPYNFFRIHNSHLINLKYVTKYVKGKGGYVQLQDSSYIEVSSRRKDDFLKVLACQ